MRTRDRVVSEDAVVRRDTGSFRISLLLYAVSSLGSLGFALVENDSDRGTIAGAAVIAVITPLLLWFFTRRGHGWPKWVLLGLVVAGAASLVSFLDERSLLAILDLTALVVLLRGTGA